MKYKTFSRSRRIKDIEGEVRRTYRKITGNCEGVGKEELLFRVGGFGIERMC